uniref:Uncharacterized protein n=1 Tax=Setaria viridis TaxID=4556 RepID=A0A4U6WE32_SETVI|nr:hypothetical protein SEVIR_1G170150v2 [Setaria viridis]
MGKVALCSPRLPTSEVAIFAPNKMAAEGAGHRDTAWRCRQAPRFIPPTPLAPAAAQFNARNMRAPCSEMRAT